jgi:hypothetical protein
VRAAAYKQALAEVMTRAANRIVEYTAGAPVQGSAPKDTECDLLFHVRACAPAHTLHTPSRTPSHMMHTHMRM